MNFYTNTNSKPVIIGIDHGYGNIKTAHTCFKTGVSAYDKEPTFKSNLLIYEGGSISSEKITRNFWQTR